MKRHHLIVLALGSGLAIGALPSTLHAQSGDALVHAERTCLDHGISPNSAAFNACVDRAASAYDRGLPVLAEEKARMASDARRTCLRYGIDPHTLGYRQCVNNEIDRRTDYVPAYSTTYRTITYPSARLVYMH